MKYLVATLSLICSANQGYSWERAYGEIVKFDRKECAITIVDGRGEGRVYPVVERPLGNDRTVMSKMYPELLSDIRVGDYVMVETTNHALDRRVPCVSGIRVLRRADCSPPPSPVIHRSDYTLPPLP